MYGNAVQVYSGRPDNHKQIADFNIESITIFES
jgi:hypothetical protein